MTLKTAGPSGALPTARLNQAAAGGGAFVLPAVTIGLFHVAQPEHRIALGQDRAVLRPLGVDEGWVLPAGASGSCVFESALAFTTVAIPPALFAEAGIAAIGPVFGALDPLLVQLVKTSAASEAAPLLYRQTMARALVAHLGQLAAPAPAPAARADDPRLGRALAYIHDHLADDLSLETMAAEAAMSPFHFSRLFKAATGQSPLRYVIAERMKLAAVLLRTTRLAVAEIAYRAGYEDVSRFSEHFKRDHGATPGAFRAS
jgi:AraC family transcriptional regulator